MQIYTYAFGSLSILVPIAAIFIIIFLGNLFGRFTRKHIAAMSSPIAKVYAESLAGALVAFVVSIPVLIFLSVGPMMISQALDDGSHLPFSGMLLQLAHAALIPGAIVAFIYFVGSLCAYVFKEIRRKMSNSRDI